MYIGVDIGGTKTLVAAITNDGKVSERVKFLTPNDYTEFLKDLKRTARSLQHDDFQAGGVAIPAVRIDRKHGRGINFGNLPWQNVPIVHDMERVFHCPFVMENDAKMGALSEAMLLKDHGKVLYVTVSTGIGIGLIDDGVINDDVGDAGGRALLLEHQNKMTPWEDFASGRAIVERYGKKAMDIHDEATWRKISRDLAKGFIELIAIMQPDVIVIGGSVGNYLERYHDFLVAEIIRYHIPLVQLPEIIKAQRPDDAVVFGCYDLAKQTYAHASLNR